MILQRLCDYYDRLAADSNQTIAQQGFAPQKVSFEIVIEPDGSLHDIGDLRDLDNKKYVPKLMRLPDCGKRTSGVAAQFLWDKADYLLGWVSPELATEPEDELETDKKKRLKRIERVSKMHEACTKLHHDHSCINDNHYKSLVQFFAKWEPDQLTSQQLGLLEAIGTGFGVFRVRGQRQCLHDVVAIREYWASQQADADESDVTNHCLVSGERETLAPRCQRSPRGSIERCVDRVVQQRSFHQLRQEAEL